MADKNIFTFDTNPFMNGLKKIGSGIVGFQNNISNMTKSVSQGVMNVVKKIGIMALSFKGVQAAIKQMPEIGKAFSIAKDIIMKNLLWPLRKAVFPLLQGMLDWIRDNRAQFVKWGQVIVNIFNVISSLIEKVIGIGQKMFNVFLGFINKVFGTNIKSLEELLNVLTFKFAVVMEFIKALIDPVTNLLSKIADIVGIFIAGAFQTLVSLIEGFASGVGDIFGIINGILDAVKMIVDNLFTANEQGYSIQTVFASIGELFGKIFNFVGEIVKSLLEGFAPTIRNIMTPIQKIVDAFGKIFNSLFGGTEQLGLWKDIFNFLGQAIGTVLVGAFEIIAGLVDGIASVIASIIDGIKWIVDNIGGVISSVGGFFSGVGKGLADFGSWLNPFDDVIVTKKGDVVPVNPNDNIMAFKEGGAISEAMQRGNQISVSIDFRGMQLSIAKATVEEANRFSESLVDSFRRQLTTELEMIGVK